MNALFSLLLSLSLSASLVMALIYVASKLFKKRLDHTWHYYIWLIVIVRLLIPYAPETNLINIIAQENQQSVINDAVIQPSQAENTPVVLPQMEMPTINTNTPSDKAIAIKEYLCIIWALVAAFMFFWKALGYLRFVSFSARGRKRIENADILDIYQSAVRSLKLRHAPILYRSRIAGVPMLIGLFRPYILIPDSQIDEQSLRYILLHELTHYKRHDSLYKWLVQIVVCIHWFNPLVYFMAKEIDKACELSCDEAVVRRLNGSERRSYGDMLLNSLQYSIQAPGRVMTLPLSNDGRLLKARLNAIMNFKNIRMSGIIISLLLSACIAIGAAFAGAYPTQVESIGNTPSTTIEGENSEPDTSNQQNILPTPQELSSAPSTPMSSSEPAQSSTPAETRTSLSTPEPSTAETALSGDISVSITSDYVLAEKTYSNHTEVSFTDKETVGTVVGYFQNLMESSIEMSSMPEVGSYLFTVSISNDEGMITYRFSAPQEDGTLYCKDLSTSEWSSMTGWIQVSEGGVYDYIKNLIENSADS